MSGRLVVGVCWPVLTRSTGGRTRQGLAGAKIANPQSLGGSCSGFWTTSIIMGHSGEYFNSSSYALCVIYMKMQIILSWHFKNNNIVTLNCNYFLQHVVSNETKSHKVWLGNYERPVDHELIYTHCCNKFHWHLSNLTATQCTSPEHSWLPLTSSNTWTGLTALIQWFSWHVLPLYQIQIIMHTYLFTRVCFLRLNVFVHFIMWRTSIYLSHVH